MRRRLLAPLGEPRPLDVLVVEDDAVNQMVVEALLTQLGCRVDLAANGLEAVERVADHEYAVVFMDCQMPELDGYAATAQIRQAETSPRRLPIIAMTGDSMPADRERCLAAGMDDYVTKPVSREVLEWILGTWGAK